MPIGDCQEDHTLKCRLCAGGDRGPHCPDGELDPGFGRIVKAADTQTLQNQFAFMLLFGAPLLAPGLVGCRFSVFLPEAGVGRHGICFPSLWMLLLKSK